MIPKDIFNLENCIHDIRTIIAIRTKRRKSSYFKQLQPIIIALKLFGVMPFTTHPSGIVNKINSLLQFTS